MATTCSLSGLAAAEETASEPSCDASANAESCSAGAEGGSGGSGSGCGCGDIKRSDFATDGSAAASGAAASSSSESASPEASAQPAADGETDKQAGIIYLAGGDFIMGVAPEDVKDIAVFAEDGEGPPRKEVAEPFGLGAHEVSNRRFSRFVEATGYVTEAEKFGWSFGVEMFISPEVNATITQQVAAAPWWLPVNGADWRHPNGPDTNISADMDHPVTQVSLADAAAFCAWSKPGGRLPTEIEWEFAARGGRKSRRYPWGSSQLTGSNKDRHRMNIWQSVIDYKLLQPDGRVKNLHAHGEQSLGLVAEYYSAPNALLDGYAGTAPVSAYGPQNEYGFYNMVGNVWEWTSTKWTAQSPRAQPVEPNTMVKKGGSFLCNPATCNRFRCSARMLFTADSAASNVGFRCAYPVRPGAVFAKGKKNVQHKPSSSSSDEITVGSIKADKQRLDDATRALAAAEAELKAYDAKMADLAAGRGR